MAVIPVNITKKSISIQKVSHNIEIAIMKSFDGLLVEVPPKTLKAMLVASGDLVETAIGIVETARGRSVGIQGEVKSGEKGIYWVAYCTPNAQKYIIEKAFRELPELANLPDKNKTAEKQPSSPGAQIHKSPKKAASVQLPKAHDKTPPEKSCDTCQLKKNGECFGKLKTCEDYKHVPFISAATKAAWQNHGDAIEIMLTGHPHK